MCLLVLCTTCMPMLFAATCTKGPNNTACGKATCDICVANSKSSSSDSVVLGSATTNGADADKLMGAIVGAILTIFRYIGVILLCWSVGQLILAFKDGDGNSKTQAAMMVVVSILLITLKSILKLVGIIGG